MTGQNQNESMDHDAYNMMPKKKPILKKVGFSDNPSEHIISIDSQKLSVTTFGLSDKKPTPQKEKTILKYDTTPKAVK